MPSKKDSFAKAKYEEMIKKEVNTYLRQSLSDPRLKFVSITKVELSSDYSYATLYWDTYNSKVRGDCKLAIENVVGKIRTLLSQNLSVRQVPKLSFKYDSQYEDELKITEILQNEINKKIE